MKQEDCQLAAIIRSGTPEGDEIMWRLLRRIANQRGTPNQRKSPPEQIGENGSQVSAFHWWQCCVWMATGGSVDERG